ncbi:MAG: carbohydrate-binding module family 20 domain-containing protein, partial [Syntrophothermus sp.]
MFVKKNIFWLILLVASFALGYEGCSMFEAPKKAVKFNVISRQRLMPSDKVYLAGNNKSLGKWIAAGVRLERITDTIFTKTLSFDEGEHLEFKFTLGSWNSEALNADGWILDNSRLIVTKDTTVTLRIENWGRYLRSRNIKPSIIQGNDNSIKLVNNWKYHEGDNPEWAKADFNDSLWKTEAS